MVMGVLSVESHVLARPRAFKPDPRGASSQQVVKWARPIAPKRLWLQRATAFAWLLSAAPKRSMGSNVADQSQSASVSRPRPRLKTKSPPISTAIVAGTMKSYQRPVDKAPNTHDAEKIK